MYCRYRCNLHTWYLSATSFEIFPGLGASLGCSCKGSCLWAFNCSVSSALVSFSSLFSASKWRHWVHSGTICLLGHFLAVEPATGVGLALGLFSPIVGLWRVSGVEVLMMLVASSTSISSIEQPNPLSLNSEREIVHNSRTYCHKLQKLSSNQTTEYNSTSFVLYTSYRSILQQQE